MTRASGVWLFPCLYAAAFPAIAQAEVHVSGEADAIKVETAGSTVQELLDALRESYGVRYQSSANLSRPLTGKFSGPLSYVLWRALQGYNFVTDTSESGITVVIYDFAAGRKANFALAQNTAPPDDEAMSEPPRHLKRFLDRGHSRPGFVRKLSAARARRGAVSSTGE
ncbi:MAG TPA: hypothetical protein VFG05_02750 [Methylocella sp.]|nr:hypothetical protein [Methylocella sp.]